MSKGDVLTTGLADALAKLAGVRSATPIEFFQSATAFVQLASERIESPIMVACFTPAGKLVLPLWGAPEKMQAVAADHVGFRKWEAADPQRLNGLISLMLLQKYRLGSPTDTVEVAERHDSSGTKWLFPVLCREWKDRLIHAKRTFGPADLGLLTKEAQKESVAQCLRRNRYSCAPIGQTGSRHEFTAYTPWFGSVPLDFDPLDEAIATAFVHPRHMNPGWDTVSLCFFPLLRGGYLKYVMPDANALAKRIQPIIPFLMTACALVVHELQMQVTSGNPRYSSRYFQNVLGENVLELLSAVNRKEILEKSMLGILIREAATSLFDGRTHPVAAWSLSRKIRSKEHTNAAEAFRQLELQPLLQQWSRPSPEATSTDTSKKTGARLTAPRIIVTGSPRGGVGKTFLTYNLARRLAALGYRVLLIELDAANPTLYFIDSEYRKKIHELPEFQELVNLGMDPAAAVRAEAAVTNGAIREELRRWTCTLGEAGLDVLGAIPGVKNVVDWLAYDAARGEDKKQVKALFGALKKESLYDFVFVDTAAGFRDLSNAVLCSDDVDLILACSLPTKGALLSTLVGLEVLRRESGDTNCLLVLNQCREMDAELFKDKATIEDLVWYWVNNGGSASVHQSVDVGVIPGRSLVNQVHRLAQSCLVEWDEIAARLEADGDWDEILKNDFGMDELAHTVAAQVGVDLRKKPVVAQEPFDLVGERRGDVAH